MSGVRQLETTVAFCLSGSCPVYCISLLRNTLRCSANCDEWQNCGGRIHRPWISETGGTRIASARCVTDSLTESESSWQPEESKPGQPGRIPLRMTQTSTAVQTLWPRECGFVEIKSAVWEHSALKVLLVVGKTRIFGWRGYLDVSLMWFRTCQRNRRGRLSTDFNTAFLILSADFNSNGAGSESYTLDKQFAAMSSLLLDCYLPDYHPIPQSGQGDCQTAVAMSVVQFFRRCHLDSMCFGLSDPAVTERVQLLREKSDVSCSQQYRQQFLSHHHRALTQDDPLPSNVFGRLVSPVEVVSRRHGEHTGYPPSTASTRREIADRRPLVLTLKPEKTNAPYHFVLLVGWLRQGDEELALVHDPLKETLPQFRIHDQLDDLEIPDDGQWILRQKDLLRLIPGAELYEGMRSGSSTESGGGRRSDWSWNATLMFRELFSNMSNSTPGTPIESSDSSRSAEFLEQRGSELAELMWQNLEWDEKYTTALVTESEGNRVVWNDDVSLLSIPVVTSVSDDLFSALIQSPDAAWVSEAASDGTLRWQEANHLLMLIPQMTSATDGCVLPFEFRLSCSPGFRKKQDHCPPQFTRSMLAVQMTKFLADEPGISGRCLFVMHAVTGQHILLSCLAADRMPSHPSHTEVQEWCQENSTLGWQSQFVDDRSPRQPKSV